MSLIIEYNKDHQLQHKVNCVTSPVLRCRHNELDDLPLLSLLPLAKYDEPHTGLQNDKGLNIKTKPEKQEKNNFPKNFFL